MKKITNIDTFSALIDRLITERIKWFFFEKAGQYDDMLHQLEVIDDIKFRLKQTMADCLTERGYEYIGERRTFTLSDIMSEVDALVVNDINIGESDRARLAEVNSPAPNVETLVSEERRLRRSNEGRSKNKNRIDSLLNGLFKYGTPR